MVKALPAGPPGHLLLGSMPELARDQLGFYAGCAREYGDVVPIRLGPRRALLISHPDAIEEVLVARSRDFVKSPGVRLLRRLLGEGLLLAEHDVWLRQRRLVQPAFHRERLATYGAVMAERAAHHVSHWRPGEVRDVHAEMMALTQAIVAKTLFDADIGDTGETDAIVEATNVLMADFGARLGSLLLQLVPAWVPTPANRRAHRAIAHLDRVIYRMIAARRRHHADRGDLLSILLHAQDADDGRRMTDRQVRDEVMTLFMAGHETTAVALSWTWYLLAHHPEIDAKLAAELDAVVGDRTPTLADLPRLPYAARIIDESLRLYPPAYAMGRQATKPTEIAGHPVASGTIVIVPTWVVHRDPRWWDEPEAFRPERWTDDLTRRRPRLAYLPFGGGSRQCIGAGFATLEAILLLATIARRFRLTLEPGQRVAPTPYVTVRPEPGPRMRLACR